MSYFLLFRKDGEDIRVKTYLVDVPKLVAVMYEAGYTLEDIKDQSTQEQHYLSEVLGVQGFMLCTPIFIYGLLEPSSGQAIRQYIPGLIRSHTHTRTRDPPPTRAVTIRHTRMGSLASQYTTTPLHHYTSTLVHQQSPLSVFLIFIYPARRIEILRLNLNNDIDIETQSQLPN